MPIIHGCVKAATLRIYQLTGFSTILACGSNFNQGNLVAVPRAGTTPSTRQGPLSPMDWPPLIISKVIFCYTQR
ncbi:hypothetical protein BDR04DRAFT_1109059 [Suillus decipiens]|nr:hypothetical protein BDR04DRAFT_1109059 [Suillus decipiens]